MTRPYRTIKPAAGTPSVPRETLREAAIEAAVRADTERITREVALEVAAFFEAHGHRLRGIPSARAARSYRRRRVALALRRRAQRSEL